jgi:hypothetical protein
MPARPGDATIDASTAGGGVEMIVLMGLYPTGGMGHVLRLFARSPREASR